MNGKIVAVIIGIVLVGAVLYLVDPWVEWEEPITPTSTFTIGYKTYGTGETGGLTFSWDTIGGGY